MLKKLRKGATVDQARRAFADCHAEGVPTRAFFMLGTPWETPETVDETIALARELRPTFSIFFLATPYPGSELREAFRAAGWDLPRDPADYRHFVEAGHFRGSGVEDAAVDPRGYYIGQCRRATREVTRAQLTDLARYPTLLREALTRFTPIELHDPGRAATAPATARGALAQDQDAGLGVLADLAGGVADELRARRRVAHDHGSGRDERLRPECHPVDDNGADAEIAQRSNPARPRELHARAR